ncbi:hypothetical protein E9549_16045 [Blastococcus sp. MG754426]|uniref:hypothetical protein n=1 Tax=unclassified Blastococcus TaxID=2619396 RepID=UPI001EF02D6F|nr:MULTISPECIES: hypothetical protein [unclassified Blastococcus]MCF6508906.1 hypothetical protein [Blastococcus sp. MG754426]MCF6513547.1 hypothetical protein [Blastococcus sp. MG754427]
MSLSELPLVEAGTDPASVLGDLLAAGHGDGLPVVPPTAPRLAVMLDGVAAPDEELGLVPPLFGPLTVRSVAWYAVLAGCRPGELPVVVAACRAALQERFNLLGLSTTTGAPAVAVLVHGPVTRRLGMTSGSGGLGTGNRANACIGRAVSMALAGIGGATAGVTDMATIGQPAKYTCCTAEAARPLPSLAQRRGLGVDVDAVTVIGVGSVVETLPGEGYREPPSVLGPAAAAMAGVALASGDPQRAGLGEQFLLLPPEPAELLAVHGWGYERIAEFLFEQGSALLRGSASALAFRAGLPGYATAGLQVAGSAADVHVVVTGGAGVKMLLLPTWPGGSRSVTVPVRALRPG